MTADGAKKSTKPPTLRSLLPTDKSIGNPPHLNPCEYGWERNE